MQTILDRIFRRGCGFSASLQSILNSERNNVPDALTAWRMQFAEVEPADLSHVYLDQLERIRQDFPDAQAGRIGCHVFAHFVDPDRGPTHVRLSTVALQESSVD